MVSDPHVFTDLAFVFLAAVVGGSLAWALRQPLILGYVFGGLLISPFTPGPSVSDPRSFDLFAEIYTNAAQEETSLQQYLLACREDKSMYATAPERIPP